MFVIFFFDNQSEMKQYSVSNINPKFFIQHQLQYYYAVYPSIRQKQPFSGSGHNFLLSMFRGKELLFEKEIGLNQILGEEIFDVIEKHMMIEQKRKASTNVLDFTNPQEQINDSFGDESKQSISGSQIHKNNQSLQIQTIPLKDNIEEEIEFLCQTKVKNRFTPQEFSSILEQGKINQQ